jgi:hypothetical protein
MSHKIDSVKVQRFCLITFLSDRNLQIGTHDKKQNFISNISFAYIIYLF